VKIHGFQFFLCTALLLIGCGPDSTERLSPKFDAQGHRGARGLYPENTLPSFAEALRHGMTTLELDLVVSADNQLVVSHEPWFNPQICDLDSSSYDEKTPLFSLTYAEIAQVDCGSRAHPVFTEQRRSNLAKPKLIDVVAFADSVATALGQELPRYNMEIKYEESFSGVFAPTVERFAARLLFILDNLDIAERTTVQSFYAPALEAVHKLSPQQRVAYLVAVPLTPISDLAALSFTPHVYSPNHVALRPASIEALHKRGVQVIPWTVNEPARMKTLISWGVDGLITDFPDRLARVLADN